MDKKERLKSHIKALETAYDNMITILNDEPEKDEQGNIKLKDTQKKVYAEGVQKSSETASNLLDMIVKKQQELEELEKKPKDKEEVKEPEKPSSSNLNEHLQ